MRVALISDIHANVLALEAVLDDICRVGVDQVVCLGDVATLGPDPRTIVDMIRDLGCPCIMGNHDEFLLDEQLIHTYTEAPVVVDAVDWCRAEVGSSELTFLKGFETNLELDLGGGANLLLFHGSPRSHMENLLSTTSAEELDGLLEGFEATVMAGGHTHIQMLRQHRGALLVNPGSVGFPFQEFVSGTEPTLMDHAEYATVDSNGGNIEVSLHRVALDRRALRRSIEPTDYPMREVLLEQYA